MHVFRAPWVLPIARPPIQDGWVAIDRGRIVRVSDRSSRAAGGAAVRELPNAVILPGLVNAHVHLELSWMAGQVPPAPSMPAWAARLMALRRTVEYEPPDPLLAAVRDVRTRGTTLVGDIPSTFAACDALVES